MPELFKWQPANLIDWQEDTMWKTLKTRMESGKVRTRKKWSRPRRNAGHMMIPFLELNEVDEIYDFFNARSGGYETFYLPSWSRETRLNSAISVGQTIIDVEQSRLFYSTPNVHGNLLHLTSLPSLYVQQVLTVNTLISTFQIGLTSSISYAFPLKSWVQRAYPVRFSSDVFNKQKKGQFIYSVELRFEEAT